MEKPEVNAEVRGDETWRDAEKKREESRTRKVKGRGDETRRVAEKKGE